MNTINLKSAIRSCTSNTLIITENYVTNGHFVISKKALNPKEAILVNDENAAKVSFPKMNVSTMPDEKILGLVNEGNESFVDFTPTKLKLGFADYDGQVYKNCIHFKLFNTDLIKSLGSPEKLTGHPDPAKICGNNEKGVWIMPIRMNKEFYRDIIHTIRIVQRAPMLNKAIMNS